MCFLLKNIYLCRIILKETAMVRQVFTPTERNRTLPFTVPRAWFGRMVEFIAFPVEEQDIRETKPVESLWDNKADERFVSLSASSLAKEWDSAEDEEWDDLLEHMEAI